MDQWLYLVIIKFLYTVGETTKSHNFTILKNPISETSLADATAQFNFINDINTKVTEIHKALKNVKKVRVTGNFFTKINK